MKRIEFIPGILAMRGNLSGKQKLQYPTDNQGAYEGPVGSVNYARNYRTSYIGAKIAKNGRTYFTVRTKTANHLTAKSKKAMALLGGAGAIYAALVMIPAAKAKMEATFIKAQELGDKRTFRAFWMYYIRQMLVAKSASQHVVVAGAEITFKNPWVNTNREVYESTTLDILIVVKFWGELAVNGIYFKIEGAGTGIAHRGNTFSDVIDNAALNVLDLGRLVGNPAYVQFGDQYIKGAVNEELTYITDTNNVEDCVDMFVTDVQPS